jgi:hypothetical protein
LALLNAKFPAKPMREDTLSPVVNISHDLRASSSGDHTLETENSYRFSLRVAYSIFPLTQVFYGMPLLTTCKLSSSNNHYQPLVAAFSAVSLALVFFLARNESFSLSLGRRLTSLFVVHNVSLLLISALKLAAPVDGWNDGGQGAIHGANRVLCIFSVVCGLLALRHYVEQK